MSSVLDRLNGPWHRRSLQAFMVIVIAHWAEHLGLLQAQVIAGRPFFGAATPTSILQLWFPRLELHLFYNTVAFIPMVVAMYYHVYPNAPEAHGMRCSCLTSQGLRASLARSAIT